MRERKVSLSLLLSSFSGSFDYKVPQASVNKPTEKTFYFAGSQPLHGGPKEYLLNSCFRNQGRVFILFLWLSGGRRQVKWPELCPVFCAAGPKAEHRLVLHISAAIFRGLFPIAIQFLCVASSSWPDLCFASHPQTAICLLVGNWNLHFGFQNIHINEMVFFPISFIWSSILRPTLVKSRWSYRITRWKCIYSFNSMIFPKQFFQMPSGHLIVAL